MPLTRTRTRPPEDRGESTGNSRVGPREDKNVAWVEVCCPHPCCYLRTKVFSRSCEMLMMKSPMRSRQFSMSM